MTELRDGTAEIMLRNQGVPPDQIPAAEAEEVMSQMVALMFLREIGPRFPRTTLRPWQVSTLRRRLLC